MPYFISHNEFHSKGKSTTELILEATHRETRRLIVVESVRIAKVVIQQEPPGALGIKLRSTPPETIVTKGAECPIEDTDAGRKT